MDNGQQYSGFTSYWRNSLADAEFGKGAFERKDEDSFNDLTANLYKLWNRMASGSYFPPPVRRVEIPKVVVTRPKGERLFAEALGVAPEKIWPSRYS